MTTITANTTTDAIEATMRAVTSEIHAVIDAMEKAPNQTVMDCLRQRLQVLRAARNAIDTVGETIHAESADNPAAIMAFDAECAA